MTKIPKWIDVWIWEFKTMKRHGEFHWELGKDGLEFVVNGKTEWKEKENSLA